MEKFYAMAVPRSAEAIARAEERKRKREQSASKSCVDNQATWGE